MFLRALATIAVLFLASCSSTGLPVPDLKPYRMEIQQGNFVSQEAVSQLKPGMTKEQVRFVLGTPLLTDIFHADRWDYVYRRQKVNSNVLEHRKIAVYFEDGKLKRIEGDVTPAPNADTAGVKTPKRSRAGCRRAAQTGPRLSQARARADIWRGANSAGAGQAAGKSWWQWLKDKF